jgi:hypothetical protein
MDIGWVARLGDGGVLRAMAVRIGSKTAGPGGFKRVSTEEFVYDVMTGEKVELGYEAAYAIPVDLNGDGLHEMVRGRAQGDGAVLDRHGEVLGSIGGGHVACASKLLDHAGEQVLCYYPDGTVRIWGDAAAADSEEAKQRYSHRFYKANQKLTATGYNIVNLGGI